VTKRINVKNILKVARQFEYLAEQKRVEVGYDQSVTISTAYATRRDDEGHMCNTKGCVAGHTLIVTRGLSAKQLLAKRVSGICAPAQDDLGIGPKQATALFSGSAGGASKQPTSAQAARTLRHLAKTGQVDWSV
jgi:hypothetical protein